MNLTLSSYDLLRTDLLSEDTSTPVYRIATDPIRRTSTIISRIRGAHRVEVGRIDWDNRIQITCSGRPLLLEKSSLFSSSKIFLARDKARYKWKVRGPQVLLQTTDASKRLVAKWSSRSAPTRAPTADNNATLAVNSEGVPIMDELVTTFVFFERARHTGRRIIN